MWPSGGQHVAFLLFRRDLEIKGFLDEHGGLVGQRTAGIVGLDGLLLFRGKELGAVHIDRAFRDLLAAYQADGQTGCLIQCICVVEILLMEGPASRPGTG